MLQSEIIIDILSKLNSKQSEISSALNYKDKELDTDNIELLFADKGKIIKKFEQWRKTPEGENFVRQNTKLWKEKITPLLKNEEKLQVMMKTRVDSLASDLRTIQKGKQVLTYYKEN